jgi:signal transduction histidine kinase
MAELTVAGPARRVVLGTWLRRALWPLTLIAGLAAESVLWRSDTLPLYIVYDLAVGFTAVAVSFAVWEASPGNRIGPLLVAYTVWHLCSPVSFIASPFWISLSWVMQLLVVAVFTHLILAYPSGKLTGRLDTSFVAVIYVYAVTYPLAELMVAPADQLFGNCLTGPCPATPPLITADPALFARMQSVGSGIDAVLAIWFLILVGRRLVRSSPRRRRQFLPIAGIAVLAAVDYMADEFLPPNTGGAWNVIELLDHGVELAIAFTFLASLYASRMGRSQVADLLARLAGARPETVEALLSRVLHDPRLRLGLWDRDRGAYLDAAGRPLTVPPDDPQRTAASIGGPDGPLGVLVHDRAVLDDPRLISAVLAGTRLALENEQLHKRLRDRLEDVQASRARLVRAEDEARRRLERDLHDGAQQRLLSIGLALQLARKEVCDGTQAAELLDESESELEAALGELRNLAQGIHPTVLTEQGLAAAVTTLARRRAVPVDVSGIAANRLPAPVESTAYFLICEALQNTVKHAQASRVRVGVTQAAGAVRVEVSDDGTGGADPAAGSGLRGLKDRVEAVGGRLSVDSPPGRGTTVRAELPCG